MKFRKGDIVSVRGIVKYDERDDSPGIFVDIPGIHSVALFNPRDAQEGCLTLVQAYFEVGDSVTFTSNGSSLNGTIIGISDEHAWIDLGGGDYCTRLLSSIERIETEGTADAAAD